MYIQITSWIIFLDELAYILKCRLFLRELIHWRHAFQTLQGDFGFQGKSLVFHPSKAPECIHSVKVKPLAASIIKLEAFLQIQW